MGLTVRKLTAEEWPIWRDLTLQALAESPDSFRPTLAESQDQPDEFWIEMVVPTVEHERGDLWIALGEDVPIGKLFASIDADFTTLYVGAMWVTADRRGTGVGTKLIDAALAWGRGKGAVRSELWVTEANRAAARFYHSVGYRPTDDTEMLREGSSLVVRKLAMALSPPGPEAATDMISR